MNEEMKFFIYLIERYAESKGITAQEVLQQWDSLDMTDYIYDMYELYHVECF